MSLPVPGDWTLFYDWDSDGTYSAAPMTVNANGTFTTEGFTGLWVEIAGMFMFTFDNSETTYSGNRASKSITGIMTTFEGLTGSFYMLQQGVPISFVAARTGKKPGVTGK